MTTAPLPAAPLTSPAPATNRRWRDRVCARLGGLCELLRGAHSARIPF